MNDKQIVVNNLITHYVQSGDFGNSVLLLHGWGDDARTFAHLQQELSTCYSVIALDLPGFGRTDSPKEVWGLDEYAKFVRDFLIKTNTFPFAIIGHSNGGSIAIRGVVTNVLQPSKLVLLASAGIRSEYKGRKKMIRIAAKSAKLLTKPLPKSMQTKLKKKAYGAIGSDLFVAEHLQETFKKIVTDDVQKDAGRIKIPTLLIYGKQDTATPADFGRIFQTEIENSRLEVIPNAGHFVHHEAKNKVEELVMEFLK